MKKICSVVLLLLVLTACSPPQAKESIVEASGAVEKVETGSILIKDFQEEGTEPSTDGIRFQIADKYYIEDGAKIKFTDISENDKVKIQLAKDYNVQENSPAQINAKYVIKIIKLND